MWPQSSKVNQSEYKKIENEWDRAIKDKKNVWVNVEIKYDGNNVRPSSFHIEYEIDGEYIEVDLDN